ncbi:MAG: DUF1232 domain-containing protein [Bacteroidales bacterium]|nr:DUF1232 domain-containing protein [Candidatus Liminaster caballi]
MGNDIIDTISRFFKNVDYDRLMHNGENFLGMIKKYSVNGSRETTRVMLELYYVMMSEQTSKFNKMIIGAAFAYQFLPNDFLPKDEYGIFGAVDNIAALYIAYKRVKKCVTPEINQKVDDTIANWTKSINEFTILKPEDQRV